jgi:hypothetical protein
LEFDLSLGKLNDMKYTLTLFLAAFCSISRLLAQTDTIPPKFVLVGDSVICVHVGDNTLNVDMQVTDNNDSTPELIITLEGDYVINGSKRIGCWNLRYKAQDRATNTGYSQWLYILVRPKGDTTPCIYSTDSCTKWNAASVTELTHKTPLVKVYPNPASNRFIIEFIKPPVGDVSFYISDVSGRIVLKEKKRIGHATKTELNIADVVPGFYILHIESNGVEQAVPLRVVR